MQFESLSHQTNTVQAQFNGFGMQPLDARQPIVKRCAPLICVRAQASASEGCRSSSASNCAISSRIWRRCTIMSIAPFSSRNSAR